MTSGEKFGRTPAQWDEIARECASILENTARERDLISYSDLAQAITRTLDWPNRSITIWSSATSSTTPSPSALSRGRSPKRRRCYRRSRFIRTYGNRVRDT